jgi:hypothetical protein
LSVVDGKTDVQCRARLRAAHISWHAAGEEPLRGWGKDIDDLSVLLKATFVLGVARYHCNVTGAAINL